MTYNYIIIDDLCDQDERTSKEKLRAVNAWLKHTKFAKRRVALARLVDCPQFWEWYFQYFKEKPLFCAMPLLVPDPKVGPVKLPIAKALYSYIAEFEDHDLTDIVKVCVI